MDSINRNQPEANRLDLTGSEAVDRVKAIVKKAQSCLFRTAVATGPSAGVRPMSVQRTDDDGTIWFLSAADSHKNAELARDPSVTLSFQGSAHSDFLVLHGRATVSTDKSRIRELWEPILKTWFTGGVNDPRVTVIRFDPATGYYWTTKHGTVVAGVKMMVGAAVGVTLDDSVEGTLVL